MPTLRVTASTLNMRSGPGTQNQVVAQLPWDFRVEKLQEDSGWTRVRLPNGTEGWVSSRYTAPAPAPAAAGGGPPYGRHSVQDSDPPWMKHAWGEYGQAEVAGVADNPRIEEYHACCSLRATSDEVAWCSSFVNWCMHQSDIRGTGLANARSWQNWGRKLGSAEQPQRGDVVVFSRTADPAKGHVGFYVASQGDDILVLGGNQGNQVRVSPYPRSRLVGVYRPA